MTTDAREGWENNYLGYYMSFKTSGVPTKIMKHAKKEESMVYTQWK